jgi:hypothetical protein
MPFEDGLFSPNAALVATLRAQGGLPTREHVAPAALVPDDIPLSAGKQTPLPCSRVCHPLWSANLLPPHPRHLRPERIQEIQSIMAGLALTPPPWMR